MGYSDPVEVERVVHVVGRMTADVARFLAPATSALANAGREQAVVMIDELRARPLLSGLHEAVDVVLAPRERSPMHQWRALTQACRAAMTGAPLHAVHLHGVLPAIVGARVARLTQPGVPLFFSPDGGLGALVMPLARPLLKAWRSAAIVNRSDEADAFARWRSTALVEPPVDSAYFALERREARHPLIVAGGADQGPRGIELVAQIAVLMSGDENLRIAFNWVGAVDAMSRARLQASGVAMFDAAGAGNVAARLSGAWIGVAPGASRGYAHFVAEAMAAGLACVALDNAAHRALIRDGVTGYLCRDVHQMTECIALLIDDAALRARIGAAARADARRRFDESAFATKLLSAYDAPAHEPRSAVTT